MAFTQTNLATVPLLETTFISDMRLIVNANTALLRTQLEDTINSLQFDLVNKYIGVDTPVNKIFSQDIVVSNSILFKAGSASSAATIATLTQNSGISSFLVDNITFTKDLISVASGSGVSTPTVVIGTSGSLPVNPFGTTNGQPNVKQQGLYVGDSTTPIPANFYGEANFNKQAISESSIERTITMTNVTGSPGYFYGNVVLSRTTPRFIYLTLDLGTTTSNGKPIHLFLHEDATSTDPTSIPLVGQTFTIIIEAIKNGSSDILTSSWPTSTILGGTSSVGINLFTGYSNTGDSRIANVRSVRSVSRADAAAVVGNISSEKYLRFYNPNMQSTGATPAGSRSSAISLTKKLIIADPVYVPTGLENATLIN